MAVRLMVRSILVFGILLVTSLAAIPLQARGATYSYAGSDLDIGGTFFPGGGPADLQAYVVVPWRTDSPENEFSASSEVGQRYYGRDGYAMFSTVSDYPNANDTPGTGDAWDSVFFTGVYPDLVDLPEFVSDSLVLSTRRAGGYAYALVDDPTLTEGIRDWNWGQSQSPPSEGQAPYTKIGILGDWDRFGNYPDNTDPEALPAGRWGFQVGANPPSRIRVGVMADGYDGSQFAPTEVFLAQVSSLGSWANAEIVSTGTLARNRFVDIHFFDITGAQEGDYFSFGVKSDNRVAAISGITFDVLPDAAGLVGDYNGDDIVNIADYVIWRNTLGAEVTVGEGADGDQSGVIDAGDYAVWKEHFGTVAMAAAQQSAVPEPSGLLLVAASSLILVTGWRRHRPSRMA